MVSDILIVSVLTAVALALFVTEVVSIGVVAAGVMTALILLGVLTPEDGLSGFSNPATVTIAAMFVLSEGVRRTGLRDRVAGMITSVGGERPGSVLAVVMLTVGTVSAFINNTAAIAILIPVILSVSGRLGVSASRLLMPASFASMLGGACTLIGTSTNILVSEIAVEHGLAPIGMFELSPVGLTFAAIGFVYLATAGRRLIPPRRDPDRESAGYALSEYITDVVVRPDSDLAGQPVGRDEDLAGGDVAVVEVLRDGKEVPGRIDRIVLAEGDVLRIHGPARRISRLVARHGLELSGTADWRRGTFDGRGHVLVEAVIPPESPLARMRIRDADLAGRLGAVPLALQHRGSVRRGALGNARMRPGDCILLAVDADRLEELQANRAVILVNRLEEPDMRPEKTPVALAIVAVVVAATAFGVAPVAVSAVVGCIAMVLTGCLKPDEGAAAINWEVIVLLAGMIPLGLAMESTGAATLLAGRVGGWLEAWGPQAVLSGILLLTILLTSVLNNQATAVLLSPVVLQLAHSMGADPRPFLVAVTYGASLSFITPVGYQTNTMVYGPGQYRFSDFFRVGAGLNLLLWIAGSLLIPLAWPLAG